LNFIPHAAGLCRTLTAQRTAMPAGIELIDAGAISASGMTSIKLERRFGFRTGVCGKVRGVPGAAWRFAMLWCDLGVSGVGQINGQRT